MLILKLSSFSHNWIAGSSTFTSPAPPPSPHLISSQTTTTSHTSTSNTIPLVTSVVLLLRSSRCHPPPPPSTPFLREVSGDDRFWFPVVLVLVLLPLFSFSSVAFSLLLGLLLVSLLDLLLVGLLKHLVRMPHPVYNKGMSLAFALDHWSFPSGHSSRVFFIASFLHLSSASLRRWIRFGDDGAELVVRLIFLWSAATSASRVFQGRRPRRSVPRRRRGSHHLPFHEVF